MPTYVPTPLCQAVARLSVAIALPLSWVSVRSPLRAYWTLGRQAAAAAADVAATRPTPGVVNLLKWLPARWWSDGQRRIPRRRARG